VLRRVWLPKEFRVAEASLMGWVWIIGWMGVKPWKEGAAETLLERLRASSSLAFRVNSLSAMLLDFWVRAYLAGTAGRDSRRMGDFRICFQPVPSFSLKVAFIVASTEGRTLDICWDFE